MYGPIMSTRAPEEAQSRPIEINGYAIVSDDDRIAGPDGLIPASLRNEKDWDCFQRALAGSDLVVLGHRSHDSRPTSGATNDWSFREAQPGLSNAQTSGGGTRRA
jgi:hypothetical protein